MDIGATVVGILMGAATPARGYTIRVLHSKRRRDEKETIANLKFAGSNSLWVQVPPSLHFEE